jgi:hypothetical protein
MNIETLKFDTSEQLFNYFINLKTAKPNLDCIFRGQPSSDFNLISSYDRKYPDKDKAPHLLEFFINNLKRFQDNKKIETLSVMEKLSFAQHYGLPTRLLDWSSSPFVAAFFAYSEFVKGDLNASHIAIWQLDLKSRVWGENQGVTIIPPSNISTNQRENAQSGWYTYSKNAFDNLEEYVESCKAFSRPALIKLIAPISDHAIALEILNSMNINFENIFPDVEGCVKKAIFEFQRS